MSASVCRASENFDFLTILTICMLDNLSCLCCHLLTFFNINLFKKFFQDYYKCVKIYKLDKYNVCVFYKGLDPCQDRHFISPDLGQNCLQRLSADDKSRR